MAGPSKGIIFDLLKINAGYNWIATLFIFRVMFSYPVRKIVIWLSWQQNTSLQIIFFSQKSTFSEAAKTMFLHII